MPAYFVTRRAALRRPVPATRIVPCAVERELEELDGRAFEGDRRGVHASRRERPAQSREGDLSQVRRAGRRRRAGDRCSGGLRPAGSGESRGFQLAQRLCAGIQRGRDKPRASVDGLAGVTFHGEHRLRPRTRHRRRPEGDGDRHREGRKRRSRSCHHPQ